MTETYMDTVGPVVQNRKGNLEQLKAWEYGVTGFDLSRIMEA